MIEHLAFQCKQHKRCKMRQIAKPIPSSCIQVSEKVNFMNEFSSNIDRIFSSKLSHYFILFHHHSIIKKFLIGHNTVKMKVKSWRNMSVTWKWWNLWIMFSLRNRYNRREDYLNLVWLGILHFNVSNTKDVKWSRLALTVLLRVNYFFQKCIGVLH